jgi:hypothetical protein
MTDTQKRIQALGLPEVTEIITDIISFYNQVLDLEGDPEEISAVLIKELRTCYKKELQTEKVIAKQNALEQLIGNLVKKEKTSTIDHLFL